MGLLEPIALVTLPLLGVIIALYLLRLRRPVAPVASLRLWSRVTRDREANSLWQRLHISMLLVLQLVALLVMIAALARPWVTAPGTAARNVILIVDVSASMGSTDADDKRGRTRLQAAQDAASGIVDGLGDGARATLIASDEHAGIEVPSTDDRARLRAAIGGLTPHATGTDMSEAFQLATTVATRNSNSAIYIFSDGAFPPLTGQVEEATVPVQFVRVGKGNPNQGITALSVQQNGGSVGVFIQVANSDTVTVTRRIDFSVDDQAWTARTVAVGPQSTSETLVDDVPIGGRVIHAELAGPPDAMPLDDQAWVVNRASTPGNVLLVTHGNRFLELALALLPTVNLYKVAPEDYDPSATVNGSPVDLTIFDAGSLTGTVKTLPASGLMLIDPPAGNPIITVTGTISEPVPTSAAAFTDVAQASTPTAAGGTADPLLKFVDLSSLHVEKAALMTVPTWGRPVIGSDKGPLLVAGEQNRRNVVVFAFDLHDSDLPVQTAFPLLLRNLVTYLLPPPAGGLPLQVNPGAPVAIDAVDTKVDSVLVEDPDGKEWTYPVTPDRRRVAFGETQKPGVYYVTQSAGAEIQSQEAFAVNLFSRDETMAMPQDSPQLPVSEVQAAEGTAQQQSGPLLRREIWPLVALLGFAILLAEWLYAQRMTLRRAWTEWQTRRELRRAQRGTM